MDMRPYIKGIVGLFFILIGLFIGPSIAGTGPTLVAAGSGGLLGGILAPSLIPWVADILVIAGAFLTYTGKPIPRYLDQEERLRIAIAAQLKQNATALKERDDAKRSL